MSFQNIDDLEHALSTNNIKVRDLYAAWALRQPPAQPTRTSKGTVHTDEESQIRWLDRRRLSVVRLFTERALEKEEFLLVCDAAREGLSLWNTTDTNGRTELVEVKMHYAKALTRLGFTAEARQELEHCVDDDFQPMLGHGLKVDILLLLGNIMREEAQQASSRSAWRQAAEEALRFYECALDKDPQRLDALALATAAAFVLGEPDSPLRRKADDRAAIILANTAEAENRLGPRFESTLYQAVAHVAQGDPEAAMAAFAKLKTLKDAIFSRLADTRFWSRALAEALALPSDYFKPAFPPLYLIVFSGIMPDGPGREGVFPLSMAEHVRRLLKNDLDKSEAKVALVSAAAGADLLLVDALLERQADVHLVLPWSKEEFRRTSVSDYEPKGHDAFWGPLFDRAIEQAATVRELGQAYKPSSDVTLRYMVEVVAGIALHAARMWRLDVKPMALWDHQPALRPGGTESFIELWSKQLGQPFEPLEMPAAQMARESIHARELPSICCEMETLQHHVKSMLFADIEGYSKLREEVIPEFVNVFLHRVSKLINTSRNAPCAVNTWGDAIYAVFDFALDAGAFATELIQMIRDGENDWLKQGLFWETHAADASQKGIRHPLSIRIGLHTGPVFLHFDPVVRQLGYTGTHVSRAARIEPVARSGEVYASEEFAAMAELERKTGRRRTIGAVTEFACEYAGSMPLAKGYPGNHRIYRLVPRPTFAIEDLAQAAHESYCAEARARGESAQGNSSMRPWKELPEDLRQANRAQVADIPNKLHDLGYKISSGYGVKASEILIPDATVEELATREHNRWMRERQERGWTYAPERDKSRKHHPLLVPWEKLSEPEKEKDRDTIRNLPRLIERAGLRVSKISQ